MFTRLGNLIEKKPWLIVTIIILITIGFSIFIPSLEFKTDFKDFAPDNALVKANNRVSEYFGSTQQAMFLLVETKQAESTITPKGLREQYAVVKKLQENPEVNGSISIITLLNTVCQLEYNKAFENCSDVQIETALNDLLQEHNTEVQVFNSDDPNEETENIQYPPFSQEISNDNVDIKNCYISEENTTITFSLETYDLSAFSSSIKPPYSRVHSMEWFLGFENILSPKEYKSIYQLSVRIEPTSIFWEIGDGVIHNVHEFFQHLRHHELFNAYKDEVYLWIKPPGQELFFPVRLTEANASFDSATNRINIVVPKTELGQFGIAPRYGNFVLPAKLSNFTAGVRYFKTPVLKRPGGRITANTTFLIKTLENMHNRLILGPIVTRLFQKYGGISWDEFENMTKMMQKTMMLPDSLSLEDIQSLWIQTERVPNSGNSSTIFPLFPRLFDELRVNALSFLSKDYQQTKKPKADLIILELNTTNDFNKIAQVNTKLTDQVNELTKDLQSVSIQTTGEGVISAQINQVTSSANQIIMPSIFIIIMIILFISFRRPSYVFLPVLVFIVSVTWLFGTMALLHIPFSIISVALVPLLIGLGVEYSVNLFVNYRAELEQGHSSIEALKMSLRDVGIAIFMAWMTTFIAFMSFLSALIPPVRDFGVLLALGISYTFIVTMTLMTSLRYIVDRRKTLAIKKHGTVSVRNIMGKISTGILAHQKKIFVVTILVTMVMGFGVTQLKTGFSMTQFIPQNNQALELFNKISDDFPSASQNQEFVLIEGKVASVTTLRGISQTLVNFNNDSFIARKPDGSIKTESIIGIIRDAVRNNNSLISTFNLDGSTDIPKTDADTSALFDYLYTSDQYGTQVKSVLHKEKTGYSATLIRIYFTSSFQTANSDETKELETVQKELKQDLVSYGDASSIITGELFITLTIMTSLTQSQILSTGISFILASFILIVIFRNPLLGAIAMIPVVFSIIWVLGTMYFIGYTLNVLTITVTSITIGVGVDYAIYITQRFRLIADKTGDPKKAVNETVSRTGSAVFIAALSSMLGFGILVTAPIPPQVQFGLITSITLVFALLTSIIVLPLVLARWAAWRKKRKGFIISPGNPEDKNKDK
jgi:predicted RND superfamily exporter protein